MRPDEPNVYKASEVTFNNIHLPVGVVPEATRLHSKAGGGDFTAIKLGSVTVYADDRQLYDLREAIESAIAAIPSDSEPEEQSPLRP